MKTFAAKIAADASEASYVEKAKRVYAEVLQKLRQGHIPSDDAAVLMKGERVWTGPMAPPSVLKSAVDKFQAEAILFIVFTQGMEGMGTEEEVAQYQAVLEEYQGQNNPYLSYVVAVILQVKGGGTYNWTAKFSMQEGKVGEITELSGYEDEDIGYAADVSRALFPNVFEL